MRRNVAHLTDAERVAYAQALAAVDLQTFADGVSFWDKQDQIHEGTHNHGGNSFLPWHRELVNRFEKLVQQVDPDMALHYWDWTEHPTAASNGAGGTVNLCTDQLFGTANGMVNGTLGGLHAHGTMPSRPHNGGPFTLPPIDITRNCGPAAPGLSPDSTVISAGDGLPQDQQWSAFATALEGDHGSAHGFFGLGSNIASQHPAFEDPFVFLLHSNVDRLFAMWQAAPGHDWRLDPDLVYGDQSNTNDSRGILHNLQPWDGTVEFGAPIPPWTPGSSAIEVKNSRHPTVVRPPCYDTLPFSVEQVAPLPGDDILFLDVPEGEPTSRALRLRVRGCVAVSASATLTGSAKLTLLTPAVAAPEPEGFVVQDLLIWVTYAPGPAGSSANGTLTVTVQPTGEVFTVDIHANAIDKPTIAVSMVLDRSGSMDEPSGVAGLTRVEILRNSAPMLVDLLDDTDGIGIVRFSTDAAEALPVTLAGATGAGLGRDQAHTLIGGHATDPLGLTAIGDGLQVAAAQLATPVALGFDRRATVVFTDGHETADKYISDVMDLITSTVFAVGLGTADQLNPDALDDLVNDTGGYLLLTGHSNQDDQLLLQKYFAQVAAGLTNSQIVVDPEGYVPVGGTVTVPYPVTSFDTRTDAIVLSPHAGLLQVDLVAPDGTIVNHTNGAVRARTAYHYILKLALPTPTVSGDVAGQWQVRLRVETRGASEETFYLERSLLKSANELKQRGVAYAVTVQARGGVRLDVAVSQKSRQPGGYATVTATLTEAGLPVGHSAIVIASVRHPDGKLTEIRMDESDPGVFGTTIPTPVSGVYRVLVRATGNTPRGQAFRREHLRTLAVWRLGDAPPPGRPGISGGSDLGKLIRCLLHDKGFRERLERSGIDVGHLLKCLSINRLS